MANTNVVVINGNLVRDPYVITTSNDNTMANFTLANNSGYGEHERADYISIRAFGKLAEIVEENLHKGDRISVVGRCQSNSWENDNGEMVYEQYVLARDIEFLKLNKG